MLRLNGHLDTNRFGTATDVATEYQHGRSRTVRSQRTYKYVILVYIDAARLELEGYRLKQTVIIGRIESDISGTDVKLTPREINVSSGSYLTAHSLHRNDSGVRNSASKQ